MSDLWKLVATVTAALKHGCVISICDLARKNVSFGLSASSDKVKHNGGAVVGPAGWGAAHLAFVPSTVWLFFFFSVEFPQLSHSFYCDLGISN